MELEPAPCEEAIEWLDESGITDLADAWDRCHRGDWMLWICDALSLLDDRERRLIACRCVRETPLGDGRKVWDLLADESRQAVVVAERYADGAATDEELADAYVAAARADVAAATATTRAAAAAATDVATAYVAHMTAAYMAAAAATATDAYVADAVRAAHADIIRAIAGNPFRDSAA